MAAQRRVWSAIAKRMVGSVFRALVVAPGVARMESQAPDVDGVVLLERGARGAAAPRAGEEAEAYASACSISSSGMSALW